MTNVNPEEYDEFSEKRQNPIDYVALGRRVKKLRKEQGIKQTELADALGISYQYMSPRRPCEPARRHDGRAPLRLPRLPQQKVRPGHAGHHGGLHAGGAGLHSRHDEGGKIDS